MCQWGTDENVTLAHPRPVSGRTVIAVDACIAPLVQALNDYGVHTVGCCCGHGKTVGSILYLQDGRQFELKVREATMNCNALALVWQPNDQDSVSKMKELLGLHYRNHGGTLQIPTSDGVTEVEAGDIVVKVVGVFAVVPARHQVNGALDG